MVYLTGYGFPAYRGGPMFYARHGRALHKVVEVDQEVPERLSGREWKPAPLWLGKSSPRKVGGNSMVDVRRTSHDRAVIVSTARTPLCKSWRGALNMTHGAKMGGHVVHAALERAKVDADEVEDVIIGCANPGGRDRLEHRAPDRDPRRLPGDACRA